MIIVAHNYFKAEDVDKVMPLLRELVKKSRAEAGCLAYDLYVDKRDAAHLIFIENWADKEALGAHGKSAHFTETMEKLKAYTAKEGTITITNPVEID